MAWGMIANIKGEKGDPGDPGEQGIQGEPGDQGPPGEDGAGIEIAGSVANYAALPSDLGPEDAGDGYLVNADGKLYIWDGDAFPASGSGVEFRGPKGDQGDPGTPGTAGADGADGEDGADGAPGTRGSLWYTGEGTPGVIGGTLAGDLYLDTETGQVFSWTD